MISLPQESQGPIRQPEHGAIDVDVQFEDEPVRRSRLLLAEPFQTTQPNISSSLQSI